MKCNVSCLLGEGSAENCVTTACLSCLPLSVLLRHCDLASSTSLTQQCRSPASRSDFGYTRDASVPIYEAHLPMGCRRPAAQRTPAADDQNMRVLNWPTLVQSVLAVQQCNVQTRAGDRGVSVPAFIHNLQHCCAQHNVVLT